MKNQFILVISGIATSGKSTLFKKIKKDKKLSKMAFIDMDDEKLPNKDREEWRLNRLATIFSQAVTNYKDGKSSIVCAVCSPAEISKLSSYSRDFNIAYILLTIPIEQFEIRMKARIKKQFKKKMLTDEKTENWYRIFYKSSEGLRESLSYAIANERKSLIIDTYKFNPEKTLEKARIFIGSLCR